MYYPAKLNFTIVYDKKSPDIKTSELSISNTNRI